MSVIPPSSLARVAQDFRDDKKKEDNRWSNLPKELLGLILRYVYYNDYPRFRATCTSWRNVTPPVQLTPGQPYQSPCLLLQTKRQTFQFLNPLYNITYCTPCRFELSPHAIIYSSGNGWLLMGVKNKDDIFFLNLVTQVQIKVPDKPTDVTFGKMCFSSSPTSSDCLIVGVSMLSRLLKIVIIKRGEENWTIEKIRRYPPGLTKHPVICNLVMHNGQCYCTDSTGNLGVFNPHDVRDSWRMYPLWPIPKRYLSTLCGNFLVEGYGEILSVFVFPGGTRRHGGGNRRTCVYKLNVSKMRWERVEDLGNRILYVSNATSILTISRVPGMGNKIYFPYFFRHKDKDGGVLDTDGVFKDKDAIFYSLATKGYHVYGDNLLLEELEEFKWSTWVLPQFASSIEDDFKW